MHCTDDLDALDDIDLVFHALYGAHVRVSEFMLNWFLCALRDCMATHETYAKGPIKSYLDSFEESCGIHVGSVYLVAAEHSVSSGAISSESSLA